MVMHFNYVDVGHTIDWARVVARVTGAGLSLGFAILRAKINIIKIIS